MSTTLSAEQRFDLITRGLEEVHGGDAIKVALTNSNSPKAIWGMHTVRSLTNPSE